MSWPVAGAWNHLLPRLGWELFAPTRGRPSASERPSRAWLRQSSGSGCETSQGLPSTSAWPAGPGPRRRYRTFRLAGPAESWGQSPPKRGWYLVSGRLWPAPAASNPAALRTLFPKPGQSSFEFELFIPRTRLSPRPGRLGRAAARPNRPRPMPPCQKRLAIARRLRRSSSPARSAIW
jgi:hypothetical protein